MRIVYFNPTGIVGGAEMNLLDVIASFRASRPEWPLRVVMGDEGPLGDAVDALDVPCDVLPFPATLAGLGDSALSGGRRARRLSASLGLALKGPSAAFATATYLKRLRKYFKDVRPDVVQTNGMKAHLLGTLAAPAGVPVVWHFQDFAGSRALMGKLLRWAVRVRPGVVRVVAISKAVAADVVRVVGPAVPVFPVYSAVDLDRFSPGPGDGPSLDAEAGLAPAPEGTVRVGLVATYARWKGHDVFLDAVSRLNADLPARFYVVGSPLYRSAGSQWSLDELKARAESLGLTGRVGFVPHRDAPEGVFRSLDVVVHASTRPEPFGRVIVEAMSCGRAVVAANDGGAAELFEDGVSALGSPPGDPDALATRLRTLIEDPALRRTLGENGRHAAVEHFDRRRLADGWAPAYGNEAGQPDPPLGAGPGRTSASTSRMESPP